MKKIEASLIKRLPRISSQTFVSSILDLSLYSLSLILLDTYSIFGALLEECGILRVLEKEGKGREGKYKTKLKLATTSGFACKYWVACMFSSLVLACMAYACGLLVMIYHWHGCLPILTVEFPNLAISWIAIVLWVYFFTFLVGPHVSFSLGWVTNSWKPWLDKHSRSPVTAWVELLVLEALVGKTLWNPLVGWVTSPRSLGWK